MSVSYTCPNPECGVTLKTASAAPPGKRVKCPKCLRMFTPVPEEPKKSAKPAQPVKPPDAGTFKLADDGKKPDDAPPAPKPSPFTDEDEESDESIKKGYGVVQDTAEDIKKAEEAKVKFGRVEDKYKKSARGPAVAMLVLPSNLLTAQGLVAAAAGIVLFVWGMWPLVFNDAPPGDEETEIAILRMLLGCLTFVWGAAICYGASQMAELGSYMWSMMGAVLGVLPVGIFAIIALTNPKVKAGFEESDAGAEEDEGKDKDDEDEEEDEEEDSDDDDDDD